MTTIYKCGKCSWMGPDRDKVINPLVGKTVIPDRPVTALCCPECYGEEFMEAGEQTKKQTVELVWRERDWMAQKLDRIWAVVDEWSDDTMPGNDAMSAVKDIVVDIMPEDKT